MLSLCGVSDNIPQRLGPAFIAPALAKLIDKLQDVVIDADGDSLHGSTLPEWGSRGD